MIILVLMSCSLPEIGPSPGNMTTTEENEGNKSLSIRGGAQVTIIGQLTKEPLADIPVYFNVYLEHPYQPYFDPHLINSNFPFTSKEISNTDGLIAFKFDSDLAKKKWEQFVLNFEFAFRQDPQTNEVQSFQINVSNVLNKDSIELDNLRFTIEK